MKKIDNRRFDAKLTTLLNESSAPTSEQLANIRERARAQYLCSAPPQKNNGTKKLRRVAMIATAVAVLLIVPLVVTILFPVTVSNANDFVKRAKLWLNDTFQLNIEVSVPPEDDGETLVAEAVMTFQSPQEVVDYIGTNILVLDESSGCELVSIEVTTLPTNFFFLKYTYFYGNTEIQLFLESIMNDSVEAPNYSAAQISCLAGQLWAWENQDLQRLHGYFDNWSADLRIGTDIETAYKIAESLRWLN